MGNEIADDSGLQDIVNTTNQLHKWLVNGDRKLSTISKMAHNACGSLDGLVRDSEFKKSINGLAAQIAQQSEDQQSPYEGHPAQELARFFAFLQIEKAVLTQFGLNPQLVDDLIKEAEKIGKPDSSVNITDIFKGIEGLRNATCNLAGNIKEERRSSIMKNVWRVAFGVGGVCMAGANAAFAPVITPLFAGFSIGVAGKIVVTSAQEILESLNDKSRTDGKEPKPQSLSEVTIKLEDLSKVVEALKQSSENLLKAVEMQGKTSETQSRTTHSPRHNPPPPDKPGTLGGVTI